MKKTFTLLKSVIMFCLFIDLSASAQTVTNGNNAGAGSLRQAIIDAPAGGTVTFSILTNILPITLSGTQIVIDKNLTITGNGRLFTTINGGGSSRIFSISSGVTVTINDLTLTNGLAADTGGAIMSTGATVVINNVTISNSTASGAASAQGGGGIYAMGGTFTLNNATISGNTANGSAGSGGGILVGTGTTLNVNNTTITNNFASRAGGGIEGNSGAGTTMTLTDVTLTNNETGANPGNGGGLHITGAGNTIITNGIVRGNEAAAEGGGLWNGSGIMTITGTTITNNTASGAGADQGGGGIYNLNGGTLRITGATINNNVANGTLGSGGGIFNDVGAMLTVSDTEISGNTAIRAGGGVEDNSGTSTLVFTNVELTENSVTGPPGNGGGLHITGAGSATFNGGTVSGNTATQGGGLWIGSGTLTLNDVEVDENTADGDTATDGGGGIYNVSGTLNITDSVITGNLATGTSGSGGGIFSAAGTATIVNTEFNGNSANRAGGAIEVVAGTYTLNETDMIENDVNGVAGTPNPGNGGGIHVSGVSTVVINGGDILRNEARREGGGLWNQTGSTMTVNNATLTFNIASGPAEDDGGGGIFNNGGILNVNGSTLSSNIANGVAGRGGAIHVNAGIANIRLSTLSGNTSVGTGGGIYNNSQMNVNASTLTLNTATLNGAGIANNSSEASTIKNTIVAGNIATLTGNDIYSDEGTITSNGFNLIGNDDNQDFTATADDIVGTMENPIDALLAPLADNGSEVQTHRLNCPSPAADRGDSADTFTDQNGQAVFNGRRDIGAYEAQEDCATAGTDSFMASAASVVYPNPSLDGLFNVRFADNTATGATVRIYEIATGKLVKETTNEGLDMQLDMNGFAAGTYVMHITSDRATETHKLIIGR